MDEHGPDAPSDGYRETSEHWFSTAKLVQLNQRQYLPTLAELIDRLTIVILKSIFIQEHRGQYLIERQAIEHDISLLCRKHGVITEPAQFISAVAILMLSNRYIWENESKARSGYGEQDQLLKMTHSINGVRTRAKNEIAKLLGERQDLKVDCFAAELIEAYGNWNVFD